MQHLNTSRQDIPIHAKHGHFIGSMGITNECINREWKYIKVAQDKATHHQS
jgi:hypothetical protein